MTKAPEDTLESDAWIAKNPGDSITGVVTDLDVAWSDFRAQHSKDPDAGNYPLITVQTEDGQTRKIHAFRTVLFNEVMKRQPKPGEKIVVTFTGYGKEKSGMNPPHIYTLQTPDRDPDATAKSVYGRIPGAPAPVAESDVPADTEGLPGANDDIPF